MGATQNGSLTLNLPEMWKFLAITVSHHNGLSTIVWRNQLESIPGTESERRLWSNAVYKDEGFRDAYRIALGTTYYQIKTGPSVRVLHSMTARFRQKTFYLYPRSGSSVVKCRCDLAFNEDASIDVGASYMHGQNVSLLKVKGQQHIPLNLKVKPAVRY